MFEETWRIASPHYVYIHSIVMLCIAVLTMHPIASHDYPTTSEIILKASCVPFY